MKRSLQTASCLKLWLSVLTTFVPRIKIWPHGIAKLAFIDIRITREGNRVKSIMMGIYRPPLFPRGFPCLLSLKTRIAATWREFARAKERCHG